MRGRIIWELQVATCDSLWSLPSPLWLAGLAKRLSRELVKSLKTVNYSARKSSGIEPSQASYARAGANWNRSIPEVLWNSWQSR